jgi:two-component sensor histidine kinase
MQVHHRVENNMHMISSILGLDSMELEDPGAKSTFDECTARVKSMAMVHDQLYKFYNLSEIEMGEYLHHLIGGLNALLAGSSGNFVLNIDADKYEMDVDEALLCGLMVSEIISNAFKHGFKGYNEGIIDVKFRRQGEQKILIITNTGNAMPEDILEVRTTSLGMSLIKTFSNQLGGKLERFEDRGLKITF